MAKRGLPVISLFSGSLGLDLGLERAGFEIRVAVECDPFAADTIRRNRPKVPLIDRKLESVTSSEILKKAGLSKGEAVAVVGGLCCQSFSTAGQRASLGDPRGMLIHEFLRVVRDTRPRFFVIENVSGMLSAAIKHRPLNERGPGFPVLSAEEELGSGFKFVVQELKRLRYHTVFDRVNAADFGVPQVRERLLFIGSRDGEQVEMPIPTHAQKPVNGEPAWVSLAHALDGLKETTPVVIDIPPAWCRFLKRIPEGGNWRDLPARLQPAAMGKAYVSWGGRSGFYRRLSWSRPAPSLTTRPSSKATLLCHPTELRPLSVREYARIQQFPDSWVFTGGPPQQYKQIGNAVPVGLGHAIGKALRKTMRRRKKTRKRGRVVCLNKALLERIAKRPRTILNPVRMRRVKSAVRTVQWLNGVARARIDMHDFMDASQNGSHR